jgi:hypothetical protein
LVVAVLAIALWNRFFAFAAAGSKGIHPVFLSVFWVCLSAAVGRKYAALSATVLITLSGDIGIICNASVGLQWLAVRNTGYFFVEREVKNGSFWESL